MKDAEQENTEQLKEYEARHLRRPASEPAQACKIVEDTLCIYIYICICIYIIYIIRIIIMRMMMKIIIILIIHTYIYIYVCVQLQEPVEKSGQC